MADSVVKQESDAHDEDKAGAPLKSPAHFSAAELLALWRHAATPPGASGSCTSPPPHLGTLTIGSIVFAPCRVQSAPPPTRGSPHAPCSHLASLPRYTLHYALAEVTGIQMMAGTVTVSFLFTDPGVDDEAISLYECIPCPPACLARWLQGESGGDGTDTVGGRPTLVGGKMAVHASSPTPPHMCCSLLERVLHVAVEDGPLPVNDIYRSLTSCAARQDGRRRSRLSAAQQRCVAGLRHLYCFSDEEDDSEVDSSGPGHAENVKTDSEAPQNRDVGCTSGANVKIQEVPPPLFVWNTVTTPTAGLAGKGGVVRTTKMATVLLSAYYRAPLTLHVFFARVFQMVNTHVEQWQFRPADAAARPLPWRRSHQLGGLHARCPPVILVLFDSYAALRRFHVYMTVRGHVVQLQDGTDGSNSSSSSQGRHPPSPHTTTAATAPSGICQGQPPAAPRTPLAFGTKCKVWLCMLRDDTAEEDANAGDPVGAARLIAAQLRRLLIFAPPIDALVTFAEHEKKMSQDNGVGTGGRAAVTAEQVLLDLLPHLGAARLVCDLHDVPAHPLRPGTNSGNGASGTQTSPANVVKVSGAIFGDRKLLVPCSPEQLTLLASVLADSPPPPPSPVPSATPDGSSAAARQRKAAQKRPRSSGGEALQALTPALLERIALGTFTDSAASALFDAVGDAAAVLPCLPPSPQPPTSAAGPVLVGGGHVAPPTLLGTVEDVYEKWCLDPARFGEAFPVFQAVYALVADVFRNPLLFRPTNRCQQREGCDGVSPRPPVLSPGPSALPRIALVLPRGNPTHHPSLSTQQFLHALRIFFTPWTVHEVGSVTTAVAAPAFSPTITNPAVAVSSAPLLSAPSSTNACVLWHQRGGLLLLFCDEPTTQLGALQDEADVVVACGKAAAAWVAANAPATPPAHPATPAATRAVYFAVISELEVVPPAEHGLHLWLPITLSAPSLRSSCDDKDGIDGKRGAPPDCNTAAQTRASAAVLRWPAAAAADDADLTRRQAEILWERLLSTVGADGNPVTLASVTPAPSPFSSSATAGRRLRHVDVLPKTLRQAVVLWRHLGPQPEEAKTAAVGIQEREARSPWPMLRALVKSVALSGATAAPVRMSDVTLVRRVDGAQQ
jgi:hypothetical protein